MVVPMIRILAMKKNPQALLALARTALEKAGAHSKMAEAAARHLVAAEAQGLPTHGMSRVPFYCAMLRNGRLARTMPCTASAILAQQVPFESDRKIGHIRAYRASAIELSLMLKASNP